MNDTDSLLVFRLQRLRNQPRTIRGRCILFYASLNERPFARVMLALAFTIFVLSHAIWFTVNLNSCFEVCTKFLLFSWDFHLSFTCLTVLRALWQDEKCSLSNSEIILPILLMSIYPICLIIFILVILVKDIIVSTFAADESCNRLRTEHSRLGGF